MSSEPSFGFVVEYVRDIAKARQFYVDVVGLTVEREHPTFVQFSHFAIASDAPMSGGKEREVYWLVDDVERAMRELPAGTDISLPLTQQPFGRVVGLRGPGGYPCYLLELARDRPSQAV